jgi:hypothetical protein
VFFLVRVRKLSRVRRSCALLEEPVDARLLHDPFDETEVFVFQFD